MLSSACYFCIGETGEINRHLLSQQKSGKLYSVINLNFCRLQQVDLKSFYRPPLQKPPILPVCSVIIVRTDLWHDCAVKARTRSKQDGIVLEALAAGETWFQRQWWIVVETFQVFLIARKHWYVILCAKKSHAGPTSRRLIKDIYELTAQPDAIAGLGSGLSSFRRTPVHDPLESRTAYVPDAYSSSGTS